MIEIAPCPFCAGFKFVTRKTVIVPGDAPASACVKCDRCGARGPWSQNGDAAAVHLWNKREDGGP